MTNHNCTIDSQSVEHRREKRVENKKDKNY
jgi:hypothetical protein